MECSSPVFRPSTPKGKRYMADDVPGTPTSFGIFPPSSPLLSSPPPQHQQQQQQSPHHYHCQPLQTEAMTTTMIERTLMHSDVSDCYFYQQYSQQKSLATAVHNLPMIRGNWARPIVIGRARQCDFQLPSHKGCISRQHAIIIPPPMPCRPKLLEFAPVPPRMATADDSMPVRFSLRVVGLNGVKVNGRLCKKGEVVEIEDGDVINFVGLKCMFSDARETLVLSSCERSLAKRRECLDQATAQDATSVRKRLRVSDFYRDALPPSSPPLQLLASMESDDADVDICGDGPELVLGICPASSPLTNRGDAASEAGSVSSPKQPDSRDAGKQGNAVQNDNVAELENKFDKENARTNLAIKPAAKVVVTQQHKTQGGSSALDGTRSNDVKLIKATFHEASNDELSELIGNDDDDGDSSNESGAEVPSKKDGYNLQKYLNCPIDLPQGTSLESLVIECMVFSSRTSLTITEILASLQASHPHLVPKPSSSSSSSLSSSSSSPSANAANHQLSQVWRAHISHTLLNSPCFGRVVRKVKDASNKVVEDKWYYDPARDHDKARSETYCGVVRTARRCTLSDKQYYFKPPPKLPNYRRYKDRIHSPSQHGRPRNNAAIGSSGSSPRIEKA